MPSLFDKQFRQTGFPQLLQAFGEPVVYCLRGGGRKCFVAIINRNPPAIYLGETVLIPSYLIRFSASCADGLKVSDIDTGGDYVELRGDVDAIVPTQATVVKVNTQDSGVIELALVGR